MRIACPARPTTWSRYADGNNAASNAVARLAATEAAHASARAGTRDHVTRGKAMQSRADWRGGGLRQRSLVHELAQERVEYLGTGVGNGEPVPAGAVHVRDVEAAKLAQRRRIARLGLHEHVDRVLAIPVDERRHLPAFERGEPAAEQRVSARGEIAHRR